MPKYYQPLLPYFQDEEIDREYQLRMVRKWFFGYYKHCKDESKKIKLINSYNKLFNQKGRTRE